MYIYLFSRALCIEKFAVLMFCLKASFNDFISLAVYVTRAYMCLCASSVWQIFT